MSYYNFVAPYLESHLNWLEDKLEEYRNERCFVFTHLFFPERAGNLNDIYPSKNWLRGTQLDRLEDLGAALLEYASIGVGRNDGKTGGEYAPIFYKTDRRIDHVFLSPHFKALDYKLMTYSYWVEVEPGVHEQRLPSDHYPIGVHVTL